MRYFSTFTGIGGFELGIQLAYVDSIKRSEERGVKEDTERNEGQGFQPTEGKDTGTTNRQPRSNNWDFSNEGQPTCVGYSEIDKYAVQVYQKHFPTHTNYGDITKINADTLPDFDLLVGGFPCQSFSIAGKRGGFEDTRGTLFFDLARILRAKRPRLFLFENVKGLLSHDNGRTFSTIISTLDELGYDLQWQVLNSKNHGVPQNRERIFIVGHLRGTSRPEVFPFGLCDESDGVDIKRIAHMRGFRRYNQTYEKTGAVEAIDTSGGGGHQPCVADYICLKCAGKLKSEHGIYCPKHIKIRRLTPIECERLQGFPDNWTAGVSDTQRYKCCGNAVTVNVIRDIAEKLLTP